MKARNTVVMIHKTGQTSVCFTHYIPESQDTKKENIKLKDSGKVYKVKPGSYKDLWEMVLKTLQRKAIGDKGAILKTRVYKGYKTPMEVKAISKKLRTST